MFKSSLVATGILLAGEASATYVNGRCPTNIKDWEDNHPGKKLQHNRLRGLWGSVWENNIKMLSAECMTMKLSLVKKDDP